MKGKLIVSIIAAGLGLVIASSFSTVGLKKRKLLTETAFPYFNNIKIEVPVVGEKIAQRIKTKQPQKNLPKQPQRV